VVLRPGYLPHRRIRYPGQTFADRRASSVAGMITAEHLTKSYGDKQAVEDLSFAVRPGVVTGFLGPNGAGKSTTMRMLVGLDSPTSGRITIDGKLYRELPDPLRHVGVLLDARAVHPGRSAYHHLLAVARTHDIPVARVEGVLDLVGLSAVAHRRAGGFSLGMSQRLGVATALLGDPQVLVLDEPVNGLDPDGVLWIRRLLAGLAREGRTVFLSSHLMSELALIADDLVVIGQGRLLAASTAEDFVAGAGTGAVRVVSPQSGALAAALQGPGVTVTSVDGETLEIHGIDARDVGRIAAEHGVVLFELLTHRLTLEEAFMQITQNAVEYRTHEEATR